MVLAAGLGTRLRPITRHKPKALVEVGSRSLIERTLDRLGEAGVETALVNLHHLGDMIERHLEMRTTPAIVYSREEALLDTGGGIAKALPRLGAEPFFAVNTDVMWLNGPFSALDRLAAAWDETRMDALLLMHSTVEAFGYTGVGDFCVEADGELTRRPEHEVAPYLFTGIQVLHPRLFDGVAVEPFSLNVLYDRAIAEGRLFGIVHDGAWFHIGTPLGLDQAEAFLGVRYPDTKHR
jgi:MurNAc alpha-1-phosphate uridylyltransferase